jgi:hypothetical protein
LPPREEFNKYVDGIWNREWLTNNGPLVNELELKLKEFLGVPHLFFVSNGTIALQIAIKALKLKVKLLRHLSPSWQLPALSFGKDVNLFSQIFIRKP